MVNSTKRMIVQYRKDMQRLPVRLFSLTDRRKLLSILLLSTICLLILTYHVAQKGYLTQWNLPLYQLMCEIQTPTLKIFFTRISFFSNRLMRRFWILMSLYFIHKKDSWRATHWILLGALVGIVTFTFKNSLVIDRPGSAFKFQNAFPSAHVITNMVFLGAVILFSEIKSHQAKIFAYSGLGVWVSLMGVARLYLGAHWLTDVVGGMCLGLVSLSTLSLSYYRKQPQMIIQKDLYLTSGLILGLLWLVRFMRYDQVLNTYFPYL